LPPHLYHTYTPFRCLARLPHTPRCGLFCYLQYIWYLVTVIQTLRTPHSHSRLVPDGCTAYTPFAPSTLPPARISSHTRLRTATHTCLPVVSIWMTRVTPCRRCLRTLPLHARHTFTLPYYTHAGIRLPFSVRTFSAPCYARAPFTFTVPHCGRACNRRDMYLSLRAAPLRRLPFCLPVLGCTAPFSCLCRAAPADSLFCPLRRQRVYNLRCCLLDVQHPRIGRVQRYLTPAADDAAALPGLVCHAYTAIPPLPPMHRTRYRSLAHRLIHRFEPAHLAMTSGSTL